MRMLPILCIAFVAAHVNVVAAQNAAEPPLPTAPVVEPPAKVAPVTAMPPTDAVPATAPVTVPVTAPVTAPVTPVAVVAPGPVAATPAPLLPAIANDDPCFDSVHDPVPLGLRDAGFDAGVGACVRSEVTARLGAHAIIDTPGFYGQLGGELNFGASFTLTPGLQVGFGYRAPEYEFAQNAVTKATALAYGPLQLHVKASSNLEFGNRPVYGAVFFQASIPYTSAELQTVALGGQLTGLVTLGLARSWFLHGRFGVVMGATSSGGGTTLRAAGRGGADVNFNLRSWLDLAAGVDIQGGWFRSFDHVLVKLAAHWRVRGRWRVETGVGAPFLGKDRTNVIFTLGLGRDL
jgi:hypothetical protein